MTNGNSAELARLLESARDYVCAFTDDRDDGHIAISLLTEIDLALSVCADGGKDSSDEVAGWMKAAEASAAEVNRLRSLLADGGKGEAVYLVSSEGRFWQIVPHSVWINWQPDYRNVLYAAPQAECAPRAALNPEDFGLPPHPTGEVSGPCVCGSWPGGPCLRCRVIPPLGWIHIDEVKGLCRDFSSRTGSVYIKDVESALDSLSAAGASERADAGKDAALSTLFDILMLQNIVTGEESYLSLRCVGVPPDQEEFVQAVKRAILAATKGK